MSFEMWSYNCMPGKALLLAEPPANMKEAVFLPSLFSPCPTLLHVGCTGWQEGVGPMGRWADPKGVTGNRAGMPVTKGGAKNIPKSRFYFLASEVNLGSWRLGKSLLGQVSHILVSGSDLDFSLLGCHWSLFSDEMWLGPWEFLKSVVQSILEWKHGWPNGISLCLDHPSYDMYELRGMHESEIPFHKKTKDVRYYQAEEFLIHYVKCQACERHGKHKFLEKPLLPSHITRDDPGPKLFLLAVMVNPVLHTQEDEREPPAHPIEHHKRSPTCQTVRSP